MLNQCSCYYCVSKKELQKNSGQLLGSAGEPSQWPAQKWVYLPPLQQGEADQGIGGGGRLETVASESQPSSSLPRPFVCWGVSCDSHGLQSWAGPIWPRDWTDLPTVTKNTHLDTLLVYHFSPLEGFCGLLGSLPHCHHHHCFLGLWLFFFFTVFCSTSI